MKNIKRERETMKKIKYLVVMVLSILVLFGQNNSHVKANEDDTEGIELLIDNGYEQAFPKGYEQVTLNILEEELGEFVNFHFYVNEKTDTAIFIYELKGEYQIVPLFADAGIEEGVVAYNSLADTMESLTETLVELPNQYENYLAVLLNYTPDEEPYSILVENGFLLYDYVNGIDNTENGTLDYIKSFDTDFNFSK